MIPEAERVPDKTDEVQEMHEESDDFEYEHMSKLSPVRQSLLL